MNSVIFICIFIFYINLLYITISSIHVKYDIVRVDLHPTMGSEQAWIRPCLIIQNNRANKFARTFVVAIITSSIKRYPHTLIVEPSKKNWLTVQSRIDFLQVRTVDSERIMWYVGSLEQELYKKVDSAISVAFDV